MHDFNQFFYFFERAERILKKIESLIPQDHIDWNSYAFRWKHNGYYGRLIPIKNIPLIASEDLLHVEHQKHVIKKNTEQFLKRKPANNLLMTGSMGTGKSSLVKSILKDHYKDGLRIIEVDKSNLVYLSDIVDLVLSRPERYIVFCDDLSFNGNEANYKALKSVLDGSVSGLPDNILIYATSNRRHLLPEHFHENVQEISEEIHKNECIEEKISLSERFGIWLPFYPFSQDDYLDIVEHWLKRLGGSIKNKDWKNAALQWAIQRGSRSARVANQFARDWLAKYDV